MVERWVISGRVQGVGYRDWMTRTALAIGVTGWVRNRQDGTVEALVCGDEPALSTLHDACRQGPPLARVALLQRTGAALHGIVDGFTCRPGE